MTLLDDRGVDDADLKLGEAALAVDQAVVSDAALEAPEDDLQAPVNPLTASLAAFLATAAAGWMLGGVFVGSFARVVGVVAALIGAGMVAVSYRTRTPVVLQLVVLPLAVVLGGVLVAPDATGGTANLPGLVLDAVRSGGLAAPPVPFDPGWRFILVLVMACLAVTAATAALATSRPRLAVFVPAPVMIGGILIQPPSAEVASVIVSLVLMVGALAVAYGADLAAQGTSGAQFEARRLGRAVGIVAALVVGLVVLSQFGLFFPDEQESKAFPPKRPAPPPPAKDRVIFTVRSELNLPWRVGVLDVYDENAWMTPPIDSGRLVDLLPGGLVPGVEQPATDRRVSVTFETVDFEGRVLPSVAEPRSVEGAPSSMAYDPRTQQLDGGGRARAGTKYTVHAAAPPDAAELLRAGKPPKGLLDDFADAPKPPQEVLDLLAQVPEGTPLYERLQFVRAKFYESVIAAGSGTPVDVPPSRVVQMLAGGEGTPYEITAAEALLARWAGVPARVGYGYYGGDRRGDVVEIRPRHGAMWVEVYFEGSGWIAIVGRPPRAKSSLNQDEKNQDPLIRPTEQLAAQVYIPLRLDRPTLLDVIVRYWVGRVLPAVVLALGLVAFYVGPVKTARRFRRRLWAGSRGPRARVAAAYAEWRDYAIDVNLGHPTLTPIEFLDVTVPDEEHAQLAWLVTRVMWGDLARDCRSEDAVQCELWARSLRRRLAGAQPAFTRALAFASRASLRDPYTTEIPNLWWPWSPRRRAVQLVRGRLASWGALLKRLRRARLRQMARRNATTGASLWLLVLAASLVLGGCVQDVDLRTRVAVNELSLPEVPAELSGYRFERDPKGAEAFEAYYPTSLAAAGELFAVRGPDNVVVATLQTTMLKPALKDRGRAVRAGILKGIAGERFKLVRLGGERVYTASLPEQRLLLAFAEDGQSYQLLVATRGFESAEQFFVDLLARQRGRTADPLEAGGAPPPDPRRGKP